MDHQSFVRASIKSKRNTYDQALKRKKETKKTTIWKTCQ